jgi:hypothetical protein
MNDIINKSLNYSSITIPGLSLDKWIPRIWLLLWGYYWYKF